MPEYCVTGGTGFIAAYLVKVLLEKGHNVRTTVRNPGKSTFNVKGISSSVKFLLIDSSFLIMLDFSYV